MQVFKYSNIASTNLILSGRSIKAKRAAEFNDPFELSPVIDPSTFTPEKLREMLASGHIVGEFYTLETKNQSRPPLFTSYARQYFQTLDQRVKDQLPLVAENTEFVRGQFRSFFDHHHRLF